jgi:quercetin dioxygenase-like cupin family protein
MSEEPFSVRRIVAGENAEGRSIVLADGIVPVVNGTADYLQIAELWRTDGGANEIPAHRDAVDASVADIKPSAGGTRFVIEVAHPEGGEGRSEDAVRRMFEAISGTGSRTEARPGEHPGMHRTDTIDYIVVLKGEIDFILETGEVHLTEGDMIVDTGVNHSWANRSGKPCVLAAVMIGMERGGA